MCLFLFFNSSKLTFSLTHNIKANYYFRVLIIKILISATYNCINKLTWLLVILYNIIRANGCCSCWLTLTNQTECNSRVYRGHVTHGLLTGVTFMAILAGQKSGMLNSGCIFSIIVTSAVCYPNNLTSSGWILTNFSGNAKNGPRNKWFIFGYPDSRGTLNLWSSKDHKPRSKAKRLWSWKCIDLVIMKATIYTHRLNNTGVSHSMRGDKLRSRSALPEQVSSLVLFCYMVHDVFRVQGAKSNWKARYVHRLNLALAKKSQYISLSHMD